MDEDTALKAAAGKTVKGSIPLGSAIYLAYERLSDGQWGLRVKIPSG